MMQSGIPEEGPVVDPILQYFKLGERSDPYSYSLAGMFEKWANELVQRLPRNPERTVALRKLLEARDAALRAAR